MQPVNLCACPKCGNPKRPHAACGVCGYASGKVLLPVGDKEA